MATSTVTGLDVIETTPGGSIVVREVGKRHSRIYCQEVRPVRRAWVFRCKVCKAHRRFDEGTTAPILNGVPLAACCGVLMTARAIKGVQNDAVACSAICVGAKGHSCECSCGGRNHGAAA